MILSATLYHVPFSQLMLLDSEGRAVLTEHSVLVGGEGVATDERRVVVVNVYCPMYDPARDKDGEGLTRRKFKADFYRLLQSRVSALEREGKYISCQGSGCTHDFPCSFSLSLSLCGRGYNFGEV